MKNQSGRSMIEMLGVLAIIGVLSLGSVAVFNAAMNRHTANNLTYDVMLMVESTVSLGPQEQMPFDASTEYNQMSSVRDANGIVNVTVQDVENDICEVLLSKAGNDVFEFRDADGNALDACADDTTDVVFAFTGDGFGGNNPVNPDENDCPEGCPAGHECVDGQCCPNVIPNGVCEVAATATCPALKHKCEADEYCSEGECLTCNLSYERCSNCGYQNEDGDWIEDLDNCGIFDPATCSCLPFCDSAGEAQSEEECNACGDMYRWAYYPDEVEGHCVSCPELAGGLVVSEEECNACGDDYIWLETAGGLGYCASCDTFASYGDGYIPGLFDSWEEAEQAAEQLTQNGCPVIPFNDGGVFGLGFPQEECPGSGGAQYVSSVRPVSKEFCCNQCQGGSNPDTSVRTGWFQGVCYSATNSCTGPGIRGNLKQIFGETWWDPACLRLERYSSHCAEDN